MRIENQFKQCDVALLGKVGAKLRAEIAPLMAAATKALMDAIEAEVAKLGESLHTFGLHEFVEGVVQSYGDRQMDLRLSQLADQLVQQSKPDANAEPSVALAAQVAKLNLAPDDVLAMSVPSLVNREQADRLRSYIRNELGYPIRILIMDRGASLAVLTGLPAAAGDGVTAE